VKTAEQKTADRRYSRKRYRSRRAAGVCVDCGLPLKAKRVRCDTCRDEHNKYFRQYHARRKPRGVRAEWLRLRVIDCLEYDATSGSVAECRERIAERLGEITPAQIAERCSSIRSVKTGDDGVAIARVIAGGFLLGRLRSFVRGDRGERYEITAIDTVTGDRIVYGWSEWPKGMIRTIRKSTRYQDPIVHDRESERQGSRKLAKLAEAREATSCAK